MAGRQVPDPPRFAPAERPRIAIAPDGSLAAIGEASRIVVVALPGATGLAEIGTDPEAAATELSWVGAPARLIVLSRYASHSTVHLLDPYGPRSLAEIRLESPMRLFATVGPHALTVGAAGAAVLTAGESHLTPYQFPARGVPLAAGAAGGQFLVALPGSIEEWDPQTRMPKRRLRLPRPAVITAVGGSERNVWMTTQQEPARIDVIPLVTRGQPKAHELPEPIAHASGHPRSDLLVCLGATSHRLYVVDLEGRKQLRVLELPGIERIEAAGLVIGRTIAALGAQAQRPLALVSLEDGPVVVEAPGSAPPAGGAAPAARDDDEDEPDDTEEAPRPSTLTEPDFLSAPAPALVGGPQRRSDPVLAAAASVPAPAGGGQRRSDPVLAAAAPAPVGGPQRRSDPVLAGAAPAPAPVGGLPRRSDPVLSAAAPAPAGGGQRRSDPVLSAAAPTPVGGSSRRSDPVLSASATRPAVAPPPPPAVVVSNAPLGFVPTGTPASAARQAVVGAPIAAPIALDASRWRDEVVAWARAVFAGVDREPPPAPAIDAVAARFELPPPARRALILLYGAHLCGELGAAPADVARVCERGWDEALGRGRLAEARLATYARSRVRLADPVLRVLDELPPAEGALFGPPGAPALLAPWAVVAPGEPLDELARRLVSQIGGAILAGHPGAEPADLYLEARARGAVPLLRLPVAAEAPPQTEPAILVVDDDAAAERLGAPIL